jgi:hypothetical protein
MPRAIQALRRPASLALAPARIKSHAKTLNTEGKADVALAWFAKQPDFEAQAKKLLIFALALDLYAEMIRRGVWEFRGPGEPEPEDLKRLPRWQHAALGRRVARQARIRETKMRLAPSGRGHGIMDDVEVTERWTVPDGTRTLLGKFVMTKALPELVGKGWILEAMIPETAQRTEAV